MSITNDIKEKMCEKTSDELISIWEKNDRNEWSDSAFEAIKQVLTERGIPLPQQTRKPKIIDSSPSQKKMYFYTKNGVAKHARATTADIIISIILPGWGVLVGLIALVKGEKRRAATMIIIGIFILFLLIMAKQF